MKKVLLFVLAVGISNVTALPTADAADYSRERGAYARVGAYPYYRGFDRVADPWWPGSGFCAYGSYVACVYSNAFCWRRCN